LAELIHKKVLKQTITKLKSNALTSEEIYNAHTKNFDDHLKSMIGGLTQISSQMKGEEEKKRIGVFVLLLSNLGQEASHLVIRSLETLNVWKTYTETLENYFAEFDSTLTKAFEDAKKQSEEQIEKQKELVRRPPAYTA
jgi:hypothetical protein